MPYLLPSVIAAAFYISATVYQSRRFARRLVPDLRLLLLLALPALALHALALAMQLLAPAAFSLNFFHAASLITAAVIALILLSLIRLPVENLLLLLFPLGALTVLLAQFAPLGTQAEIAPAPGMVSHILLSILAYGLLTIAMLQSLLLLFQDHQLKHKHPSGLIQNFPPLQTMESLLFGFLWAGWLLLSLSLLSGWLFLEDLFAQHLAHKTLLSCLAWVLFAVLLWGRHQRGWRGFRAIRWTLSGFCLLMLAYFGSKLVREFILHV
ncbi:cytochrome C assembly protein [Ventosimonas gracilis]|uniref:Cytochrome C assembly protein n=1 Tax=Ventosimonas gracilis TaxID=1680762 RepID=A0A139SS32_9GAMM|nr:cytochrome c biogenesis protein CcsA [Ventosimonas gracilis]KXU37324.1 cytochrome C assembly protein [Ventosimonas gracilis]